MTKNDKPILLVTRRSQKISEQTKKLRRGLFTAAKRAVDQQQDAIRGYALITWDDTGEPTIALNTGGDQPVATAFVPVYVMQQLQRYVALNDVEHYQIEEIK